jgi:hypothetical protein
MGDELVAEEIEIDPMRRASPLRAPEQLAVETARGGNVVDGECEVERRKGHLSDMSLRAQRSNPAVFWIASSLRPSQ